jgi:AhpD family alkylhydroperoxidase
MQNRINVLEVQPEGLKAMLGMEKFINGTNLQPLHKELIKIRASQINGCAYCINMHSKDARKLGETEQRIYLLNAWKETKLYTEEERVILQLTEEITLISHNQVSNETYARAIAVFDEAYLANIVMMIVTINMWNRIGIFSELQPA